MSEISGGLIGGILQGYKSGSGFAKMDGGIRKGLVNGVGRHSKFLDPALLTGTSMPVAYFLGESTNAIITSPVLTSVYNLAGASLGNFAELGTPTVIFGSASNPGANRAYIDMSPSGDLIYSVQNYMIGKKEITIMMVVRMAYPNAGNCVLFELGVSSTEIGDIVITAVSGQKVRVSFTGNTGVSVSETFDDSIEGKWFLLTVKCRLNQPQGVGSEMEIYVNGSLNMTPVSNNFTFITTNTFLAQRLNFGNNPSASGSGSHIAAALVFDYWVNSSDQIRLENFFRHYYGFRF